MPENDSSSCSRKAKMSLKITIVGGNIGGLATAYALQKVGHKVSILEKGDGTYRSSGIIPCPPNMTRVLERWGVLPELIRVGNAVDQFRFMRGETGETLGVLKLYEELMSDLLANFLFMQHGDLVSILLDLALREGVKIRYHTEVVQIQRVPAGAVLASGETLLSDLVIGADGGVNSVVRPAVLMMFEQIEEQPTTQMAFTFSIPVEKLREHPELKALSDPEASEWSLWTGDGYLLYGSLVDAKQRYAALLSLQLEGQDLTEYQSNWTKRYPLDHFDLDMDRFEPRIQKLLELVEYVVPTSYVYHSTPENIVCDLDRVVISGEAGHLMMPTAIQATALCIEDADTLGNLLSHVEKIDEIPGILAGYEELRLERCTRAKEWEWSKLQMLTLPNGPEQVMRDEMLRRSTETEDWKLMRENQESAFREVWGEEVDLYAYDAKEQVEDWWGKWGSMIGPGGGSKQAPAPNQVFGFFESVQSVQVVQVETQADDESR